MTGFAAGIPLMAILMSAIYGYLGAMINLVLPTIISPLHVVACFIVVMLIYQLSKLLSIKKVNEISMSEALKAGME